MSVITQTGLSPQKREFDPRPVHVEFTMDGVVLGQVFLLPLRVSGVSIIPQTLHTHIH